jgi:hypothetical protein
LRGARGVLEWRDDGGGSPGGGDVRPDQRVLLPGRQHDGAIYGATGPVHQHQFHVGRDAHLGVPPVP